MAADSTPKIEPAPIGFAHLAGEDRKYPPVISPEQLAQLLGRSRRTIYYWISQGRLNGAVRKRGKHFLILRDIALTLLFFGEPWNPAREPE
ncbi:MAG: helix-turn-helix domain-containing protein [Gemmataceae bacterium]|nr:helix-turn-helix domain-containing protein [Gemmataceae bacterium]